MVYFLPFKLMHKIYSLKYIQLYHLKYKHINHYIMYRSRRQFSDSRYDETMPSAAKAYFVVIMLIRQDASALVAARDAPENRGRNDANHTNRNRPRCGPFVVACISIPAIVFISISNTCLLDRTTRTLFWSSKDDHKPKNDKSQNQKISN